MDIMTGAILDEATPDISDQFITRVEAAQLWGCTRANIHYHIEKGHLHLYDVGGLDMLLRAEVEQLKANMKRRQNGASN